MKTEFYRVIKSIVPSELSDDDKSELLALFMTTGNSQVRDHLAMLFADIHYDKAVPFIIKKAKEPALHNNSGVLIASLRDLNAGNYFGEFTKMILTSAYESRLWALDLIDDYVNQVSRRTRLSSLKKLKAYKATTKEKKAYKDSTLHFVREAIQIIEDSLKQEGFATDDR